MKNVMWLTLVASVLAACTNEGQLRETLRKNPEILFEALEGNAEQFVASLNRSVGKVQQIQAERQQSEIRNSQERDLKNPKRPVLRGDRRLSGDDSGKIVIVEYADFQCPACRVAYGPLKEFKNKHKGQVQFYYKNMPLDFHQMAYPSARYFEALRLQDHAKALKFYELVFENQRQLVDESFLKTTAKWTGADMSRLQRDLQSDAVKRTIDQDRAEFESFGFSGTPALIVNGVGMVGAPRLEDLERIVALTQKN